MTARIIVGVDGSASSLDALDVAVREARWRQTQLHIVHAFAWPRFRVPLGPSPEGPPEGGLRHEAEQIVSTALKRAEATLAGPAKPTDPAVTGEVIDGFAAASLLTAAESAALVVLGNRGLGGFTGLLIGSVAVQVAAHAPCPVMVQRGRRDPTGPVVVGVDGSAANTAAIEFAFSEAAARGAPLMALTVWLHPFSGGPDDVLPLVYDPRTIETEARQMLSRAVSDPGVRHPEVEVVERVARGRARRLLIDATTTAQLIVVGSRGHGMAEGLLLGSVSHAVLRHANCPVAIVPDQVT